MPISYAPTSWNPVVGCTPVSEGCKNCWAMKLHNQRHEANVKQAKFYSGLAEPAGKRRLRSYEGWREWVTRVGAPPGGWAARARQLDVRLPMPPQYDQPFEEIQLFPDRLSEPLRWRKPRTVAVCFMGDLWHPEVPDAFIDEVFATMAQAERHKFLVLTKRAERMYSYLSSQTRRVDVALTIQIRARTGENSLVPWPLPNVWLGVTAENQRMADERIPLLLKTPAAHHWVSLEPMLGPVDLAHIPLSGETGLDTLRGLGYHHEPGVGTNRWPHLDWVVVGGESGPGHRPMDLQWAADIYAQCRAANVPCYFKQRAASRPGQPSGVAALDTAKELPWTR